MTQVVGQNGLIAQSIGKANLISLERALGTIYKYCKQTELLRFATGEGKNINPKAVPALHEEIL